MELKEFLQLILAAGATIDTLWNIFIGVHFALITAIYFLKRAFVWQEKVVLSFAYFMFAWFNYWALVESYAIYNTLVVDAKALPATSVSSFPATFNLLTGFDYSAKTAMVTFIHAVAICIVLLAVFGSKQLSQLWHASQDSRRVGAA